MAASPTSLVNASPPHPTPTTSTLTFALSTPPRSTSPSPSPSPSPPSLPPPPIVATPTFGSVIRSHRQSYLDGAGAIVLFFLSTLLICGLQRLTANISDFPAPILAMVLVAAVMILTAQFLASMDGFYAKYLRGATDLLNRHMSVGFTVPFTMIMNEPMPSSRSVGLIIAGYITTGILNAIIAYMAAYGVQAALLTLPPLTCAKNNSVGNGDSVVPTATPPQEQQQRVTTEKRNVRIRSCFSEATTLWNVPKTAGHSSPNGSHSHREQDAAQSHEEAIRAYLHRMAIRAACFVAAHPMLCASLAGVVLVGIPVAAVTGHETTLDVFVLFALWFGTLVVQAAVGGGGGAASPNRHKWRPVLAALCNAVLWSSLGNMAYLAAKTAARHHATADVLATFHTGTTLADRIHAPPPGSGSSSSSSSSSFGAGDLAVSILDAGIVSWGLKLFECRAQLLSRAGATIVAAGAALAVVNLVCWPVTVSAMGLEPASRALAFAARSVTLALAGPAMSRLGGDVGLNAAMVVFNGIIFQVVMGLIDGVRAPSSSSSSQAHNVEAAAVAPPGPSNDETLVAAPTFLDIEAATPRRGSATSSGGDTLADSIDAAPAPHADSPTTTTTKPAEGTQTRTSATMVASMRGGADDNPTSSSSTATPQADAPATVALGTAVGINAAAMGTAYLYENAGRSAPYAALSMTVFGVMTVVFTSIQPLAGWVIAHVG